MTISHSKVLYIRGAKQADINYLKKLALKLEPEKKDYKRIPLAKALAHLVSTHKDGKND